jgi:UDP-2,3-diacylglucosamine pyrophosphatase LpxH
VSEEDQVAEAIKGLPKLPKGKKYYWISGNHDLVWLKKNAGFDPLVPFAQDRPDVEYLGKYSAYIYPSDNVCVQLIHPASGTGTSVSGQAQKFIDNLHPDRRVNIALFGHWHSPMSMYYKGTRVELAASFMGPTNLSIRNGWANVTGGKIVDIVLDKSGSIQRYRVEDILFTETSIDKLKRIKV